MKKRGPVAILGAGISGLSCAQVLQAAGVSVRVFERAATVGGRCATRLWQGHLVDLGVQFFTAQSGDFKKELLTRLRQFRPIISPVLDRDNQIIAAPPVPRFYVLQGNSYFAHVLSQGLDVRLNAPVESVAFRASGVECLGETYRAVISALPAPETTRVLGLKKTPAVFDPCIVALLEYAGTNLGRSRECYGHVLGEGPGAIHSSYCENNKVGRIVGSKTVFVVQTTAAFSRENAATPPEVYLPGLIREHEQLWDIAAGQNTACYGYCWTNGLPRPGTQVEVPLPAGAFMCGDSRTESTVENVWLDGQKAAQEVLIHLAKQASK